MAFRIGITIGDVVERDGDLLGDGVNIAARLEGLAEVGGICISRAVHEQVANKLSVQFADIGAQEVKNIPTPVHAYMVAMRREDGTYSTPQVKKPVKASPTPNWMWPVAVTLVGLSAIGAGGFLYFTKLETQAVKVATPGINVSPAPSAVPVPAPTAAPTAAPASQAATSSPPPAPSPPPIGSTEKFAATNVPFVSDKTRTSLAGEYAGARDFKAFSLNTGGFSGWVTAQPSEEAARTAAVEQCQKRADAAQSPRKCELYAVGDYVVYAHGKPPVPPLPWVRHDAVTEQPFASKDVPLTRDAGKTRFENIYVPGKKTKTIALGPGGAFFFFTAMDSVDEAVRRSLESCGAVAGVPCMIIALDDNFVVPIPTTLRATGFFKAAGNAMISPEARDDVARRIADATSGWNAVAVGAAGRPGLGLKAATEQAAVNAALADCVKRDSDCHVIAIGPFSVGPH
jgi:adenylate cyclase